MQFNTDLTNIERREVFPLAFSISALHGLQLPSLFFVVQCRCIAASPPRCCAARASEQGQCRSHCCDRSLSRTICLYRCPAFHLTNNGTDRRGGNLPPVRSQHHCRGDNLPPVYIYHILYPISNEPSPPGTRKRQHHKTLFGGGAGRASFDFGAEYRRPRTSLNIYEDDGEIFSVSPFF